MENKKIALLYRQKQKEQKNISADIFLAKNDFVNGPEHLLDTHLEMLNLAALEVLTNMSLQQVSICSHFVDGKKNQIHRTIDGCIEPFVKDWYMTLTFEEQKKLFLPNWNAIELGRTGLDRIYRENHPTDFWTRSAIEQAYLDAMFPPVDGTCYVCQGVKKCN